MIAIYKLTKAICFIFINNTLDFYCFFLNLIFQHNISSLFIEHKFFRIYWQTNIRLFGCTKRQNFLFSKCSLRFDILITSHLLQVFARIKLKDVIVSEFDCPPLECHEELQISSSNLRFALALALDPPDKDF